jgi:hypothetical protein
MTMNVIEKIVAANYRPTDADVEQLAFAATLGLTSKGTYLRILAAAVQDANVSKRGQLGALNKAHDRFYPVVLKGVGGTSLEPKERIRRGTFARTSLSVLRGFVRGGGDLRGADLNTLTKSALQRANHAPGDTKDRAERAMSRANGTLLRAARRLARREPIRARELIQRAIEALREAMPAKNAKPEQRIVRAVRHNGEQATAH